MFQIKNLRRGASFFIISSLVFSLSFSQLMTVQVAEAASYSVTWHTQSDFQNNTAGQGGNISATTTVTSYIDTTSSPGNVKMGPGPVGSVSDNFGGTYHLDSTAATVNTRAAVSANKLQRATTDSFTDLTSAAAAKWGAGSYVNDSIYDSDDGLLYLFDSGGFGTYNPSSGVFADLSSNVSGKGGVANNAALVYDASRDLIYWFPNCQNYGIVKLDIRNNNTASYIASNLGIDACYGSGLAFDTTNNYLYYLRSGTGIVSYTPSGGEVTQYASTTLPADDHIFYNPIDQTLWISGGGGGGNSLLYSITNNTVSYPSFGGEWIGFSGELSPIIFDTTANAVHWVNTSQQFATYSGGSVSYINNPTASNGSKINRGIAGTYDAFSGNSYITGWQDFGNPVALQYSPIGGLADFTSALTTAGLSMSGYYAVGTAFTTADGAGHVFWSEPGGSKKFIVDLTSGLTQYGQSTTLATVSSGIAYATLTKSDTPGTGSVSYYLSNDNGSTWVTATPGVQTTFTNPLGTQLKYKVALTGNATVSSVSISYNGYETSILKNLKKDATADSSWVSIAWNATLPTNTELKFRTRGATQAQGPNALYSASWSDYYVATTTGAGGTVIKANGSGGASNPTYEYMEVEATLISDDGVATPTLANVTLNYALNTPPSFDPNFPTTAAGGAVASEVTTSSDPNWGQVRIDYSVEDSDTNSGSNTPGFITPSFDYRMNSGDPWHNISSSYLSAGATNNEPVLQSPYSTYSAYWNARAQVAGQYSNTAQVRVTANDNETIYNLGYATTSASTLDTKGPSVSSLHINGSSSTSTITIVASDNTTFKDYKLSNNSDLSSDGVNASSGIVEATSTNSLVLNQPWTLNGTSTESSVYLVARDIYGNTSTTSAFAPIAPNNFDLNDISDASANNYKLIVSWSPYTSAAGATFAQYEIWRSTDNVNFSLVHTITDPTINYFLDTSVASTTRYYYEARTIDTDGDSSPFSPVANAQPIGAGASSLPPVISNVTADTVKNTSARITWTTNSLSNSLVNYGIDTSYGDTASSASYITNHQVYLTGLQPNTTYHFKVSSTDFFSNAANNDNGGASYTFTTNGGPVVTNVTVNSVSDTAATIFWNSDRSADSHVYYSTNADLSNPSMAGSANLVATTTNPGVYSHEVQLTGLSASTNYYFYVTSTDADSNTTTSNNNGQYYSLLTTHDTTPPVISNISEPVLDSDTVVVVWQTDKLANTQLEYGQTASTTHGMYDNTTVLDSTLSTTHVATLTGLTPENAYYFRVISADAANNTAVSDEQTFTTPKVDTVFVGGGTRTIVIDNTPASDPPVLSSITVDPVNTFDATINVSGKPDFRAIVRYGEVSSTTPAAPYDMSGGDSDLSGNKNIKLTGLKPATTYHFIVDAVNAQGELTSSTEQIFTTKFLSEDLGDLSSLSTADIQSRLEDAIQSALPSINPPYMTTAVVSSTTVQSAMVSWNTNIKAYASVAYASDDDYTKNGGTYTNTLSEGAEATTSTAHSISIPGLQADTKYHYSVRAFVFPQVVAKSADYTFTTKAGFIKPQILDVKPDSFRVIWATDSLTTSAIGLTDRSTGISQTISDQTLTTAHDLTAPNLASGHTFDVKAYGYDTDGNLTTVESPLPVTTTVDTTAPVITSLRIDSTLVPGRSDIIQSIVSWKTDKPSNSTVYYEEGAGPTTGTLKNKVENDTGFVQDHVVILPSLKPTTVYRIQVSSTDQAGNTLLLPMRSIVTPQESESIIDIIFKNFSDTFNFIH